MSKTIKFTISDEIYQEEIENKLPKGMSVQDFVRRKLFPAYYDTLTPFDAVTTALAKYSKGDLFTVPEIFGDAWNLPNGVAGQFGKKFGRLVEEEYHDKIKFTGNYNKRNNAIYILL